MLKDRGSSPVLLPWANGKFQVDYDSGINHQRNIIGGYSGASRTGEGLQYVPTENQKLHSDNRHHSRHMMELAPPKRQSR